MSENKPTVSLQAYIRSGAVQERLESMLNKRAGEFTVSLMSVVNSNTVLQECPPETVVKAALTAAGMNLPINPNLGFAYIIPYRNGKTGKYEAQFQMGYKGFIQLAQRSGQFKRINATDVREGEYLGKDRMSGELNISWVDDETERNKLEIVGYVGYFRLTNGFEKEHYMTKAELTAHAKRFSQSFKKGYGLWVDDFDSMAKKTVLKLLISKYGALSTAMQEAILADQAAVEEDGYKYVDNDKSRTIVSEDEDPKTAPIDGEVVDPPAPDDVDQTPPEDKPAKPSKPPKAKSLENKEAELPPEPPITKIDPPAEKPKSDEKIGGMRRSKLFAVLKDRGITGDPAKQVIYSMFGVESVNDLLVDDFDEVLKMIGEATDQDLKDLSEAPDEVKK